MKRVALLVLLSLSVASLSSTPTVADLVLGASLTDTTTEDGSFDADDENWKIFGGYRFSKFFGVEGQYVDFGEFEDSVGGMSVATEITSFGLYAVGGFQVWRFDLFGKAGLASWDTNVTKGPGSDDSGTDLAYGIGAALRIGKRLWVRAEHEVFELDNADVDMTSLGVDFRF